MFASIDKILNHAFVILDKIIQKPLKEINSFGTSGSKSGTSGHKED